MSEVDLRKMTVPQLKEFLRDNNVYFSLRDRKEVLLTSALATLEKKNQPASEKRNDYGEILKMQYEGIIGDIDNLIDKVNDALEGKVVGSVNADFNLLVDRYPKLIGTDVNVRAFKEVGNELNNNFVYLALLNYLRIIMNSKSRLFV